MMNYWKTIWEQNKILKVDHHLWCAKTWNPSFIFKVIMNKHFYVDKQFVVHQFIHLQVFNTNLLSIEIKGHKLQVEMFHNL
jgi:hypothetical protein